MNRLGAARAYIFDLDGVLVDSNALHVASWQAVAEQKGFDCPHAESIGKCGLRTVAVIRELLRWPVSDDEAARLGQAKESIYREWIQRDGIAGIPGAGAFLNAARRAGISCAVGSSAPRANVTVCLRALHIEDVFQATVSGEDVPRGKPAPDIFLAAAEGLGATPADCIVFEDAPAGIAAARAAGMRVVALATSHAREQLAGADLLADDFHGLAAP